jgi:hypothetical protein
MSLGNGNAKASNKGSNYSKELKQIKLLNLIEDGINGIGLPPSALGLAKESTLQALLAAVDAQRDYEIRIVNDSNPGGEVTFLEVRYWDSQDGTLAPPVYYLPGDSTPYTVGQPGGPVAPLSYVPTSTLLTQILGELTAINADIDVALSTRATEATQLLVKGVLDAIKLDSANLDAALSTRASETTLVDVKTAIETFDAQNGTDLANILNALQNPAAAEIDLSKDFFKNLITVSPYNQVELRLESPSYLDFVDAATSNSANISLLNGARVLDSGTNAAGKAILTSKDFIEYRPGSEIYGGGTAAFSPGVALNTRRVGIVDDETTFANSLTFGYEGTSFNIRYTRDGVEELNLPQASWDDPCDGSAGSKFTLDGTPVAIDFETGNVFRFRAGLFGYAGWVAEILSPDGDWVTVYTHKHANTSAEPVFSINTFKVILINENGGNTSPGKLSSQCWNGGATSQFDRINSVLTERSLAQTVRSVITGETSAGGGGFVNVKVAPSGSLETNASQDTHDNLNANANIQVGDVDVSGANPVPTTMASTTVIPNLVRSTGAGTIPVGARSFSIANVGAADADILGGVNNLKAGEVVNFDAGLNNTYGLVVYDATGTELLITYNS